LSTREPDGTGASFAGQDLRGAQLKGAVLRSAVFREAVVEGADLTQADLAGADFRDARAGEADFGGAMLEDARFDGATLRFASFRESVIDGAAFEDADLWGAKLDGAEAVDARFRGARLEEASLAGARLSGADFRDANLKRADLSGAVLKDATLDDAQLAGARLDGADLGNARLAGVDLSGCTLARVRLANAWLERTRLRQEQLGDVIGEEAEGDFGAARLGYLALEQNFRGLGDPEAASWAYRKGRRMGKLEARRQALLGLRERRWVDARKNVTYWASDVFAEWLCDYGESLLRVARAFLVVFLVFLAYYDLSGSLVRDTGPALGGPGETATDLGELAAFTLLTMTTAGPPDNVGVKPRSVAAYLVSGLHGAIGTSLIGLFGFVLGNRIRR
jgi:uncharacterized protein YjbI with pentapeptide repeats